MPSDRGDRRDESSRFASQRATFAGGSRQFVGGPAGRPLAVPSPQIVLVGGFALLILVGWLLLMLPIATSTGQTTPPLDALFTAASAVCVTGLVVVDTATHWSPVGQGIILALIQLGGLGFMTASTLLFLLIGHRTSLRERILLREALGVTALGEVLRLALLILALTASIEAIGVIFFFTRFLADSPPGPALWQALFHTISSFNNAGFDLHGGFRNLTAYRGDFAILLGTSALVLAGGFSFTFFADLFRVRSFRRLTLDSKLVLVGNVSLLLLGWLVFWLIERGNGRTLGEQAFGGQALDAFFLSVSARTAGFNTLDLGGLTEQSLFLMMALMFVGTASGSTGGGIKVNTFVVLALAVWATVLGRRQVEAFGREIPTEQVYRALAVAFLAIFAVFVGALALTTVESSPFLLLFFEATSAFGTVGLSVGITPTLTAFGRLVIVLMMFLGRVGPLTFVLALSQRDRSVGYRYPVEEVKIG